MWLCFVRRRTTPVLLRSPHRRPLSSAWARWRAGGVERKKPDIPGLSSWLEPSSHELCSPKSGLFCWRMPGPHRGTSRPSRPPGPPSNGVPRTVPHSWERSPPYRSAPVCWPGPATHPGDASDGRPRTAAARGSPCPGLRLCPLHREHTADTWAKNQTNQDEINTLDCKVDYIPEYFWTLLSSVNDEKNNKLLNQ